MELKELIPNPLLIGIGESSNQYPTIIILRASLTSQVVFPEPAPAIISLLLIFYGPYNVIGIIDLLLGIKDR